MKAHYLPFIAIALATGSCEKVKNLASSARDAAAKKIGKTAAAATTPANASNPELQKLVDQTAEGAVFRKDLPFPASLEVKTTRKEEVSGRTVQSSAIGTEVAPVNGTRTTVAKYERAGDQVRYTLLESSFAEPIVGAPPADGKKPPAPPAPAAPASPPVIFNKSGNTWKADRSQGFRAAALSQSISPVFDELLIDAGLAPRSLWFTGKRLKPGDKLTITGKSLPMLLAGNATGNLTLTLTAFEPVHGHPCGVFEFSGNYSRKQVPDFEGNFTDMDVTVQSGKLWLSLLYPVVLREEADTIHTTHSGTSGGLAVRGQGAAKVSVTREWKASGK